MRSWWVGMAALVLTGCDPTGPYACTASVEPGVVVEIYDAATGAPVAGEARGVVRDGLYQDSLAPYGFTGDHVMLSRRAADERPGTYAIVVAHPEYELWVRDGVRVEDGRCHVETRTIRAELEARL